MYPGCGKSALARYLVDQLLPTTEAGTTCYFFFKSGSESYRSLSSAMCSILRQLFEHRPALLSSKMLAHFKGRSTLTGSFSSLWRLFINAARQANSGDIICIIDGLDECSKDDKKKMLAALNLLYHSDSNLKTPNIRFLLTSSPFGYFKRHFQSVGKEVPHIDLVVGNQATTDQIFKHMHIVTGDMAESIRRAFY